MSLSEFLFELLSTPSAQEGDPAAWVGTLAAHALIVGGGVAALLLALRWPQVVGTLLYSLWESVQIFLGGQWADAAVDLTAVALGQCLIWAAWQGRRPLLRATGLGLAAMTLAGLLRRLTTRKD